MFLRVLNRLFGRTDSSIDAINAFVEGSASTDEQELVEQMMRENPALEKDLATQRALLDVLDRVDNVEASRSFAVTPEMVAAAERSESGISRFAELFAPQRKLAFAPAIIAGIAALSVALLTIGDITDTVNQSSQSGSSFVTSSASEASAAAPVAGGESAPQIEMAVETESGRAGSATDATAAPLATEAMADDPATLQSAPPVAGLAIEPEVAVENKSDAISSDSGNTADTSLASPAEEPPSIAPEAPLALIGGDEATIAEDEQTEKRSSPGSAGVGGGLETAELPEISTTEKYSSPLLEGDGETAFIGEPTQMNDCISLPLWQLQIALAALAVAAIGAWAGLRRVRGE